MYELRLLSLLFFSKECGNSVDYASHVNGDIANVYYQRLKPRYSDIHIICDFAVYDAVKDIGQGASDHDGHAKLS